MTHYRFWSGLHTIGGNIMEVQTAQARVICDFGLSVGGDTEQIDGTLSELEFLLATNQLPSIPYLYETESFKKIKLASVNESTLKTTLFISHLHLDHMGGLQYLPEGTVVYLSEEAYRLYYVLIKVGEENPSKADIRLFDFDTAVQVGDITVTPKWSDHDSVGCSTFFIETKELKLIHSGDVRLNGEHPERIIKWANEAKAWKPDVLLIEGTSFSFDGEKKQATDEPVSEKELLQKWGELLQEDPDSIILYNPYIRNIERIKAIGEETELYGRKMVFEPAYAEVLHAFYPEKKWRILESTQMDVKEYVEEVVTLQELIQHPSHYVLQNSYKNKETVTCFNKGIYVHSNGEPLGDYDARYSELLYFLEIHQFSFVQMGTSGHANREDLLTIAEIVGAKQTIPWHSFKSEAFEQRLIENGLASFIPEVNKRYLAKQKTEIVIIE